MLIIDELSFKFVENEGFRELIQYICHQLFVPSRTTMTKDCYNLFCEENDKLRTYFQKSGQRLSLTTDTWTSNRNITYLCLTKYFIHED